MVKWRTKLLGFEGESVIAMWDLTLSQDLDLNIKLIISMQA